MKHKHRVTISVNGLVNATIVQKLQERCGMSEKKKKTKKKVELKEQESLWSTDAWHKTMMYYLQTERTMFRKK